MYTLVSVETIALYCDAAWRASCCGFLGHSRVPRLAVQPFPRASPYLLQCCQLARASWNEYRNTSRLARYTLRVKNLTVYGTRDARAVCPKNERVPSRR